MKITKFGHCCLLIEEGDLRILIDPGKYSDGQNDAENIDVVLITHEHFDHLDIKSVRAILKNNPKVKIVTNSSVGEILNKENFEFILLENGGKITEKSVLIEAYGEHHAIFHSSVPPIQNTGYFIAEKFFYPGDAFVNHGKQVEILALPSAGPWMKISEAIDYALSLNPKVCFPVHESVLSMPAMAYNWLSQVLNPKGIKFIIFENGKEYKF